VRGGLAIVLLLFSVAARSQEGQLQGEFRTERERLSAACSQFDLKSVAGCLEGLVTEHPLYLSGWWIAPQNGFAAGPAFVYQKNVGERWRLDWNADAVAATSGSWRAGVYLKAVLIPQEHIVVTSGPAKRRPLVPHPRPEFNAYVQTISLTKLFYFGLGPSTSVADRALFGESETIAGGNVVVPIFGNSGLALFGELNGRFANIRGGAGSSSPPITTLYTEATAPGLTRQPAVIQPGAGVRFIRSLAGNHVSLNYSAVFQQFEALGSDNSHYSFGRYTFDLIHGFPLYRNMRSVSPRDVAGPDESPASLVTPHRFSRNREGSITLLALLSESEAPASHAVPFYFQPTLGGSNINAETQVGSYADYRFRAPNVMYFRAGIEHSIWRPLGAMALADAGRVALTRSDLNFNHFIHSYGIGLTLRAGGYPAFTLLYARGGHEGNHTIAALDTSLLGGTARPSLF
jgi:hypothetical protein